MKKTIISILAALALLSCGKDNGTPTPGPTPTPTPTPTAKIVIPSGVNISPTVPADGSSLDIPFTAAGDWTASATVTKAEGWISVSPESGKAGSVSITINVQPNESAEERKATVQIKCGDETCSIYVTQVGKGAVVKPEPEISFDATPRTITTGGTTNINVTTVPSTIKVNYASSDPAVATVDAGGKVTAVGPGTATVTISTEETEEYAATSRTLNVTVTDKTVPAINVSTSPQTVTTGGTMKIDATVEPNTIQLKYKSSDTNVATVDADGTVTAKAAGTATITVYTEETAECAATSASFSLTVTDKAVPVITVDAAKTMIVGKTESLGATVNPGTLTLKYLSGSACVSVDASGNITANSVGTTTITVSTDETSDYASVTAICTVTVNANLQPGSVTPDEWGEGNNPGTEI